MTLCAILFPVVWYFADLLDFGYMLLCICVYSWKIVCMWFCPCLYVWSSHTFIRSFWFSQRAPVACIFVMFSPLQEHLCALGAMNMHHFVRNFLCAIYKFSFMHSFIIFNLCWYFCTGFDLTWLTQLTWRKTEGN